MLNPHQLEAFVDQRQRELLETAECVRRGQSRDAHIRSGPRHRLRRVAASYARRALRR